MDDSDYFPNRNYSVFTTGIIILISFCCAYLAVSPKWNKAAGRRNQRNARFNQATQQSSKDYEWLLKLLNPIFWFYYAFCALVWLYYGAQWTWNKTMMVITWLKGSNGQSNHARPRNRAFQPNGHNRNGQHQRRVHHEASPNVLQQIESWIKKAQEAYKWFCLYKKVKKAIDWGFAIGAFWMAVKYNIMGIGNFLGFGTAREEELVLEAPFVDAVN